MYDGCPQYTLLPQTCVSPSNLSTGLSETTLQEKLNFAAKGHEATVPVI